MKLISVYDLPDRHQLLYDLLAERDAAVNISHKAMPSWEDHVRFVDAMPYEAWYFICDPKSVGAWYLTRQSEIGVSVFKAPVGACYLTRQSEIGVSVFKAHQRKGYAKAAVTALMERHGARRYVVNISPANLVSQWLFSDLGFDLCQLTYAKTST